MNHSPSKIGRFDVKRRLGKGGMGVVYLAIDQLIDRPVAVKLLRVHDDEVRERFLREARAAGRLQHPNIVTIFDVGEHEGQPFIAMEYISGGTLEDMIRRSAPLSITRKLSLIRTLCDGLGHAHQSGIIHRDVKPANVMVTEKTGILKILDFGVARLAEGGGTTAGMVLGTPAYMSPEQIEGEAVGIRSDVFSVGAVLYELLVYRRAFPGKNDVQIRHQIVSNTSDPLTRIEGVVHPDLIRVLRRAMAAAPEDRYETLQEMEEDLAKASARLSVDLNEATIVFSQPVLPSPSTGGDEKDRAERRAERVAGHVSRAKEVLAQLDLAEARAEVEQALLLEPDSREAGEILTRVQAAEEDGVVREALDAARQSAEAGDLSKATSYVDEALRVRPQDPDALDLQREITDAVHQRAREEQQARAIEDSLTIARRALEAGAFEPALRAADEVLAYDAAHESAISIRNQATEALEDLQRQEELARRAQSEIDQAWAEFDSGETQTAIQRLEAFEPDHPRVREALDELGARLDARRQREQEEAEQRELEQWLAERRTELRAAVGEERWDDAERCLQIVRERGRATPDIEALEAEVAGAKLAARHRVIDLRLAEARAQMDDDLTGALTSIDDALALDPDYREAQALRAEVQRGIDEVEAERRREVIGRAVASGQRALEDGDVERAQAVYDQVLTEFPDAEEIRGFHGQIRAARRRATLHRVLGKVTGPVAALWARGPGAVQAGASRLRSTPAKVGLVMAVVIVLAASWLALRPAPGDHDAAREAESLWRQGELVAAANVIEQGLSLHAGDATLEALAENVLTTARTRLTEAREAAAGMSSEDLSGAAVAGQEAERLDASNDRMEAIRTYARAAVLYRDAAASGTSLADLVDHARGFLSAGDLVAASRLVAEARAQAPDDTRVVSLVDELLDEAQQQVDAAARAARAIPRATGLPSFARAGELREDAERLQGSDEPAAAVQALVGSAAQYEEARLEASGDWDVLLAGILRQAEESLDDGELLEAADAVERGLGFAPRNRQLGNLARQLSDTAEAAAVEARGRVSPSGATEVGEIIRTEEEARAAADRGNYVSATELYVAVAVAYREAAASVDAGLAAGLTEATRLSDQGDLEGAATVLLAQLVDGPASAQDVRVTAAIDDLRGVAEQHMMEAKGRAADNVDHPAYRTATEQEGGARRATGLRELSDAMRYYGAAATYFDQAADAFAVQPELEALLASWEQAYDRKDEAGLLDLYPAGQGFFEPLFEYLRRADSVDWRTERCDMVERNAIGNWFSTCRVSVTVDGRDFDQSYDFWLEEVDGRLVFVNVSPGEQ